MMCNIDKAVMRLAGLDVVISVLLAHFHSPAWLWLTGFMGLNLFQASFTGFCPLAAVLKKFGVQSGSVF